MPQQHPLGRGQEKILLVTGTGGVALVGLFALQSLVQAQDQDHHVAVLHHRHPNRTYRYYRGEPLYPFGYGLTYGGAAVTAVTAGDRLVMA